MTTKNTSWANRSKQAVATTPAFRAVKSNGAAFNEGFEPIAFYYSVYTPEKMTDKKRVLKPGDVLEGTYEGTMPDKFNPSEPLHKLRTSEGIVVLPSVARIRKGLKGAEVGGALKITYNGKNEITSGPGAGKSAHSFDIE